MATDREANLRIRTTLDGMDKAAEQTATLRNEISSTGDAATEASSKQAVASEQAATAKETETAAIEQSGAAAQSAGAKSLEAYARVRETQEAAIAAWRAATTAAEESGSLSAAAVQEVTASFAAQADAIIASGASIEAKRVALASIESQLRDVLSAAVESGGAQSEQASIAGEAYTKLRAQIADVNAAVKKQTEAFRSGAVADSEAIDQISNRVALVQAKVDQFYARVEAGNAPARNALRQIAIQYEELRQKIIATHGSIEAATPEEIAEYNRLGVAIRGVIAKQGQYLLATQLAQQQAAAASGTYQGVTKTLENLAGGYGGVIAQGTLYGAITYAAILASEKLANALDDDAHVVDKFKEGFSDSFSSIKRDLYDAGAAFISLSTDLTALVHTDEDVNRESATLEHSLETLAFRVVSTKEATAGLKAEQAAGLPFLERFKSTAEQLNTIQSFYNTTLARGALGQKEWSQAIAESGGTLAGLLKAIDKYSASMAAADKALKAIKDAEAEVQREHAKTVEAIKSEIDALNKHIEAIHKYVAESGTQAESQQRLLDLYEREIKLIQSLDQAHDGTTKSITQLLTVIQQHLQYGDRFSQQLQGEAALLQSLTKNTDGLTDAQRTRLQTIIDTIKATADAAAKQAQLRTELNAELDSLNALKGASQAELDARVEKIHKLEDEIVQTNAVTEAQKAQVLIQQQQAESSKSVSSAAALATGNLKDGTGAIRNYGEEYQKAKEQVTPVSDAVMEAALAAAKAGEAFDSSKAGVAAAGDEFGHVTEAMDSTAKAADRLHNSQFAALAGDFDKIAESIKGGLLQALKDANEESAKLVRNLNASTEAGRALANVGHNGASVPTVKNNPYPGVTEGQ